MRHVLLAFSSLVLTSAAVRADLFSYVAKPEPEAGWSVVSKTDAGATGRGADTQ